MNGFLSLGAILQPIPEHPKRDFIFCLSTAFGDAYLFQVKNTENSFEKKNVEIKFKTCLSNLNKALLLNCKDIIAGKV